ncbi:MAG: hypothetical protein E7525_01780, partial [Ruminococcaceae bacterium]|nr:hypothetical protein [Oscillospiraceae bacterium]
MKEKLFRMWRSGITMLLVLCMVVGLMAPAAFATQVSDADNDGVINYVSLGASNVNGYGIRGYLPGAVTEDPLAASKADLNVYGYLRAPDDAYPAQIAAALERATGKEVVLGQLAISSMRTEEVRYLLDDTYEPDAYMDWRFTGGQKWFEIAEPGGISALRNAYKTNIANADVITLDIGWNNFGVYAFNNIKTILADGNYWKAPDFSAILTEDEKTQYESIKAEVMQMLTENTDMASEDLMNKLELMADVLVYATIGACSNFDIVMEKIYELNDDANVVVINIQNLADDMIVEFEGVELALGDIYGELIDMVNMYRASASPYADKYLFANAGDVTTYLDEIQAWNGDPTTLGDNMKDCFDMYDDGLYVRSIVEYMMAGQALSGLFQGFRDMAASYGLEAFKNDSQYTYEFALDMQWLNGVDLGKLDLANPDTELEFYGAAVAKHLKNLRENNYGAYNYVFENLTNNLTAQKAQLEAQKANLPAGTPQPVIDQIDAGIAQLTQAIDIIVPTAKAEFEAKFTGVYNTYVNTLNYAYDVVATIVQYAASINTIEINANSLNGFNNAANNLMNYIANSFVNSATQKFYYELQKNGIQNTGVTADPVFNMDENLLADPAIKAIAVLAVRYELGNSFFVHPNEKGHDEITAAVLSALENNTSGDEFTEEKVKMYLETAYDLILEYYDEAYAYAYGYAEQNGYIAEAVAAIDELIVALKDIESVPG